MTGKELGGHSDTKGVVAALHFVLSQSAKYDIDDTTLQLEIQQLGLPKENADALVGRTGTERKPLAPVPLSSFDPPLAIPFFSNFEPRKSITNFPPGDLYHAGA